MLDGVRRIWEEKKHLLKSSICIYVGNNLLQTECRQKIEKDTCCLICSKWNVRDSRHKFLSEFTHTYISVGRPFLQTGHRTAYTCVSVFISFSDISAHQICIHSIHPSSHNSYLLILPYNVCNVNRYRLILVEIKILRFDSWTRQKNE